MSESLESENQRLRDQVEAYRQQELTDLRSRLAEAERARDHYRQEAQRNADVGRQIAAQAEQEIQSLRAQLEAIQNAGAHTRRFGTS
jgi:predicted ATPase